MYAGMQESFYYQLERFREADSYVCSPERMGPPGFEIPRKHGTGAAVVKPTAVKPLQAVNRNLKPLGSGAQKPLPAALASERVRPVRGNVTLTKPYSLA